MWKTPYLSSFFTNHYFGMKKEHQPAYIFGEYFNI